MLIIRTSAINFGEDTKGLFYHIFQFSSVFWRKMVSFSARKLRFLPRQARSETDECLFVTSKIWTSIFQLGPLCIQTKNLELGSNYRQSCWPAGWVEAGPLWHIKLMSFLPNWTVISRTFATEWLHSGQSFLHEIHICLLIASMFCSGLK